MREPLPTTLRTILVATDFSPAAEAALAWATDLAAVRDAQLLVVHAVTWHGVEPILELDAMAIRDLLLAAEQRLQRAVSPLRDRGVVVSCRADVGEPAEVVLRLAAAHGADLVVVGTRALTGWRHLLLGSVAQRVIERSACPVVAVHAGDCGAAPCSAETARLPRSVSRALGPRRVLVATDFSADSELTVRKAAALFDLAGTDSLVLMHAIEPPTDPELPALDAVWASQLEARARSAAAWRLSEQAEGLGRRGLRPRTEVRVGAAAAEIVNAAHDLAADLVVVGTRGETGLAQLLLGSTAARVVQHADCPVLVVPRPHAAA